jgi:protein involved in polysaccharide export with SLBB domain
LSCRPSSLAAAAALAVALCVASTGCSTYLPPIPPESADTNAPASILLHEGDVLQIKFPSAPDMDSVQGIRADGKITILNVGEVKVSGLTPAAARDLVLSNAAPQLRVKDVSLSVQSSAFIVYVTGAVAKPGKLISDRPLTVPEAVIEAGIEPEKSNLKKVKIIRTDASGHNMYQILDLNAFFNGEPWQPFTLKPYDVIFVPEKFTWF